MFGKSQRLEFQCLEKPKFKIPMSGKAKFRIPMFGKRRNLEFQCLEKAKIQNSNVWKSQNLEFQSLDKGKI